MDKTLQFKQLKNKLRMKTSELKTPVVKNWAGQSMRPWLAARPGWPQRRLDLLPSAASTESSPLHRESVGPFGCSSVNIFRQKTTATLHHPAQSGFPFQMNADLRPLLSTTLSERNKETWGWSEPWRNFTLWICLFFIDPNMEKDCLCLTLSQFRLNFHNSAERHRKRAWLAQNWYAAHIIFLSSPTWFALTLFKMEEEISLSGVSYPQVHDHCDLMYTSSIGSREGHKNPGLNVGLCAIESD